MKVYLACTVRGDRAALPIARRVAARLEAHHHTVLTTHLLAENVDAAEAALTEQMVYSRDLEWLEGCGLLVAEASGSSYGVGFEVGYVLGRSVVTRQRVLLLCDGARAAHVSRLITGNQHPNCTVYVYRAAEDLVEFIDAYLERMETTCE